MSPEVALQHRPLIAILRGLTPTRALSVAALLIDSGFRAIEVPLNSPEPFKSIELIARTFAEQCSCGAGTVLSTDDVQRAQAAGARLIVSPNTQDEVIGRALSLGMLPLPGIATATEAFAALRAGAQYLKLFPANSYGPGHLRALRSVLPASTAVYPVGGIGPAVLAEWLNAGASGFGFGSELFKPDYSDETIQLRAQQIMAAWEQWRSHAPQR